MSRSMAVFALALAAMLAMGAGDERKGASEGRALRAAELPADPQSAVETALEKQVSVKLKNSPLKETAAYLADLSGVNVLLDSKALADAGIAEDIPVSFQMANVSLRAALHAMLAEHELGYTIPDDNVLSITTADAARTQVVTRVFDVADLIPPAESTNEFETAQTTKGDADSLIDLITSCVKPTSWGSSGGTGGISYARGCLFVANNLDVEREVVELLATLRKVRAAEKGGSAATVYLIGATPAEDSIRDQLKRRKDFDFKQIPITEFANNLRRQGIAVSIDQKRLSDAGIALDAPLTLQAKQVSPAFAMRTMFKPHEMGFIVRDDSLVITSDAASKEYARVGIYPVADLVEIKHTDTSVETDFDSLIDVITSMVAPTSWPDGGGTGGISPCSEPFVLVISQTEEIHEQIADMLAKMRAAKHSATETATTKPPAEVKNGMVVRVHHVASKEDSALDQYIAVIRNLVWTEGGSYIGKVPGAIIVRHTPAVQQRIKNLLTEIDGSGAGAGGGFGAGGGGLGGGGAFQIAPESTAAESQKGAPHAPGDKTEAPAATTEQTPVERALDKPTEFEFIETPLKDVAAALSKKSGINIILDEKAITDAGGTVDMPFTVAVKAIRLRDALRLTLQEHELNFLEIDDNVLQITSDAKAKEFVITRTYEVRDLAEPGQRSRGDETPLDGLVDLLTSIIAPTTWTQSGGTGSIAVFGNQLVISQTREIQEQIIDLLAALRLARDKPETYCEGGSGRPVSEAKLQELLSGLPKPRSKVNKSNDHERIYPPPLSDAEMRKLLETRQDLDFHETPLKDVAEYFGKFGLRVQMHAVAITDAGGTPDMPITFSAKNVRLETALKLMLQPNELDYIIEHGVLLITSDVMAKERVFIRLYCIRDLVADPSSDTSSEGASYDNLIDTITSTIFPTSWDSAGGTGSLKPFPLVRVLVCSQTQEAHEEISKVLKMIRAQRTARPLEETTQPKTKGENVTRFYRLTTFEADAAGEYLAVVKRLIEPSKYAYLGKVPGGIVAHCPAATHERIKELLMKLEALPEPADGANKGTARGRAGRNGVLGSGAF